MSKINNDLQDHSDIAISIEGIIKQFPSKEPIPPALSGISAQIKRGSFTGLIGPDGAGKTTLLRIIAGLLTQSHGQVFVEKLDAAVDTDKLRVILGYMPQKFGLYEDLTVMENLLLYANLRGVTGQERTTEFERLLNFTALERFTTRQAGNLSGGMKQKLGLACTLLGHPKILLLDEPSVGVDPISRRELWKMVTSLVTDGITVIWSTSYLDEAELCADVLLLNDGKLVYSGEPNALTNKLEGRTVQIQDIQNKHRTVLRQALREKEVMDGILQGRNVRLLLRNKGVPPALDHLNAGASAKIVDVKPRFEDAFMDILGGGPGGDSVLTSIMKPVEPITKSDIVIEAVDLTKQFGTFTAVDRISFKVKRGEIFGLLGPNGAGKSTTFKMMCGLLTPTSGKAQVLGIDLQKSPGHARQQLGYMAQKFSLYGDLTVKQNLQFFSSIYGLYGTTQSETIDKMVNAFNLTEHLNSGVNELSLGFKQRLALACSIMHEPPVLFLDEPTSGVDPVTRREFWTHINGLVEKGVTIIVTTHFMDEADYCDRIGLVYKGKIIATGTPDDLKALVTNEQQPDPTMEDAFIDLVMQHDSDNQDDIPEINTTTVVQPVTKDSSRITTNSSIRRLAALCQKEYYQIIRDPSNILIAFVLPLMMLFIFGYGINLDNSKIRIGLVMDDSSPAARHLKMAFAGTPYIEAVPMNNHRDAAEQLTAGHVRGLMMIQPDFGKHASQGTGLAPMLVITDGSETNTANFVSAYATGVYGNWQQQNNRDKGQLIPQKIAVETRFWFNPAALSHDFIIPGSIAIIMTVIGALLTSMVVAREWERGTMEAILSTPISRMELLCSKFIPYYLLGIISMTVCTLTTVFILKVPLRGSVFMLFIQTSLFLGSSLGLGLLLSTATRNQFNAAQAALNAAYLPAIMLSGFFYEISSMPTILRAVTYLVPARYFVSALQTLFLAGNIWRLLFINALFLLVSAAMFLGLTYKLTSKKID